MSEREPSVLKGESAPAEPPPSGTGAGRATLSGARRELPSRPQPSREPRPDRRARPTFYAAGFWRRAAAAGIDLAILIPVSLVMCWLAGLITGLHLPPSRYRGIDTWLDLFLASDPALLGGLGLTLAIGVVYALVFQVIQGRTPGMRVLKTRIIDLYGDPPSTARCAARTAGYLAGLATLGLGFLWIGFDTEKRGLHDWIAGTYVITDRA